MFIHATAGIAAKYVDRLAKASGMKIVGGSYYIGLKN
jgi:hypothetical protein